MTENAIVLFMYELRKRLWPPLFKNMVIKTSNVHDSSTWQADTSWMLSTLLQTELNES